MMPNRVAVRRAALLAAFYILLAWLSMRPDHVQDPDLGWHLRAGEWMLDHRAVPLTDPFSAYGQDRPWVAYSWLFEVFVAGLYRRLGPISVIVYTVAMCMANLLALQLLLRRLGAGVQKAVVISGLAAVALTPLFAPRPWLFTTLFFIVTLHLLTMVEQTRRVRHLLWIPLVFVAWANIHIQFVYGLALIGMYAVEPLIATWLNRSEPVRNVRGELGRRAALLAACVAATLVNPYGIKVYVPVLEVVQSTTMFQYITELHAMDFRHPAHWIVLAMILGAAFTLGRERETRPLPWLLLGAGVFVGFRATRDIWMPVIAAAAIMASVKQENPADSLRLPAWAVSSVVVVVALMTLVLAGKQKLAPADLEADLAREYPAAAVRFIESHHYAGPLFNHFDWGGFLMWRFPAVPVSIDGRANLHGDQRIARAVSTWSGAEGWAQDPELCAARLVIAQVHLPLATLLRSDPRFDLVYTDDVAAVFVARTHLH